MTKDDPWLLRLFDKLEDIEDKVSKIESKVKILWAVGCFTSVAFGGFILERIINAVFN